MNQDRIVGATAVLRAFVEANARQDEEAMKACLSEGTLAAGGFSGPMPAAIETRLGEPEGEDDQGRVIIPLYLHQAGAPEGSAPMDEMKCVMVEEKGAWKFDLETTMAAEMQQVDEMMQQVGQALGEAIGGVMGAVGDAFEGAFGGDGDEAEVTGSMWEDAEEQPREEEYHGLPELTLLHKATFGASETAGGEKIVASCDAEGLMEQSGGDNAEAFVRSLDSKIWDGVASGVNAARKALPAAGMRLRSVRVEPALQWGERCLVLDGADLVYRIDLRDPDGQYSKEEMATIIPGVLAGLTEQAAATPAGRSVLPTASHGPGPLYYEEVIAPRCMRAIARHVGGPVALDAEWDMLCSNHSEARAMCLWGLNRVLGAIGLAFPEGGDAPPEGWLRLIRFSPTYGLPEAAFENGVLDLRITPSGGEKYCLYEHQIRDVLAG